MGNQLGGHVLELQFSDGSTQVLRTSSSSGVDIRLGEARLALALVKRSMRFSMVCANNPSNAPSRAQPRAMNPAPPQQA